MALFGLQWEKYMKKHLKLIIFILVVLGGIVAVIGSALNEYHDKNTWAVLQITIGGAEIEEDYAKGEVLDIPFAQVKVDKVLHEDVVILTSESDIEYNGQVIHRLRLPIGEQCQVRVGDQVAVIKMCKIWMM